MKKLYFLFILLLGAGYSFAQKNFGPWEQLSCYKGLYVRIEKDHYDKKTNQWFYLIEFQNRYNQKVGFTYYFYNPATEKPKDVNPGYTFGDAYPKLKPGDITRQQIAVVGEGNPIAQVFDVCFVFNKDGQTSCTAEAYKGNGSFAQCDNGTPNYIVYTTTAENDNSTVKSTGNFSNETSSGNTQQKRFDNLIVQGDNAFGSKNYDNAMGYYMQAQNTALTDEQKSKAKEKYSRASEARQTEIRGQRVAAAKNQDNTEDVAYTAAAGAAIGAMSLINDGYTHRGFSGKFQVGVGYDQTPMVTNAAAASHTDKVAYPTIDFGLKLEILNNKPVNINLRGLYSVGLHAFETGVSGTHVIIGVDGGLQFWYKTTTKFKLFADFGWYHRVGDRKRDQDAVNGGESATDDVREGKYNYKVVRFGFGPMLHLRDGGKETWLKPGVYFDKLSFAKDDKPTLLVALNANIKSAINIEAAYGKDYPAGGTANFPGAFTADKQNYFSIRIIRQGKLW